MRGIIPPATAFPWTHLEMDIPLLLTLVEKTEQPGDQYGLGAKAPSLTAHASEIAEGRIDCSGYFRWLIRRTTGLTIPDGSFHQMQWLEDCGFKDSSVEGGKLCDGVVRAAYMRPVAQGGVGHIALIHNGRTIESSSKRGPGRRPWTGMGWQSRCRVWVLTMPTKKDPAVAGSN